MKKLIYLMLLVNLVTACDRIPSGLDINVTGSVIDTVKNKSLANAKVIIIGKSSVAFGATYTSDLYTTRTDKNGNFSFTYKTDGNYYSYLIGFEPSDSDRYYYFYKHDGFILDVQEIKIGDNKNIKIKAREVNLLIANIKVDNIPVNSINISGSVNEYNRYFIYCKKMVDTTFYFKVFPDNYSKDIRILNKISYRLDNSYKSIIDTIKNPNNDTIYYQKNIFKIDDFKLHP